MTTDTLQQALERAGIKANLGWNYAMSALEMASLMQQVKGGSAEPYANNLGPASTPTLPASLKSAASEAPAEQTD